MDFINMEIYKDIKGYEKHYMVSNFGNVKSKTRTIKRMRNGKENDLIRNGKNVAQFKTPKGYVRCTLSKDGIKKNFLVHRLVGIAFLSNKNNKAQINHKNGIKNDNGILNLEWVTDAENQNHATLNNLRYYQV